MQPKIEGIVILTRRQKEALSLKSNGLRDKQIAERMHISKSAVQIHLRAACDKLKAHNTTHGVAIAVGLNLIHSPMQPEIADLEHHAFNLGLLDIVEAYVHDRLNMETSAELKGDMVEKYRLFLMDLIKGASAT